ARQTGSDSFVHPAAMTMANDEAGRFYVLPIPGMPAPPMLSVYHTPGHSIAVAANEPVGIALVVDLPGAATALAENCSAAEKALVHEQGTLEPENGWPARLLAAKEAVAGLPVFGPQATAADFAAIDCMPGGQFLIQHNATGARYIVMTERIPAGVV